jgi:hypothetical protein
MKWIFPIFAALASAAGGGCLAPPVESPPTVTVEDRYIRVPLTVRNKVDILFMIDNSNSMAPKQEKLKERFPSFIQRLRAFADDGLPASYHIGVVTSDMGAGSACKVSDGGKLNGFDRTDQDNFVSCQLGGGLGFIDFNQLDGTANVMGTVEEAFRCIASVGDQGCGFEHPLESVHRALTSDVPENHGFLREDAVLAVVFLADEDDCSAPPDTDLFEVTKNGTDYSQPGNYGPFNSFRCTQFGIFAGGAPLPWPTTNTYSSASPAPFSTEPGLGKLFSLDRYIDLFTRPRQGGGVKDDPANELMLVGIFGDRAPFRTLLSNPRTVGPYVECATYDGGNCTVVLDKSCKADGDDRYDAVPALRLGQVIEAAANHDVATSICDGSYDQALQRLSEFIKDGFNPGCLGAPVDHPETPDCVVEEIVEGDRTLLPWCGAPDATKPCWQLIERPECEPVVNPKDGSMQRLGLEIQRDTQPQGTVRAEVQCAIVAASTK